MKKVLLSLLLITSVSALFAQNPLCPIDIKSNQGAGNCPDLADGTKATAKITLTFSQSLTCAPLLKSVRDNANPPEVRFLTNPVGTILPAPNDNTVEYCVYGENNDNFFNQPDLVAQIEYTADCPGPGGFIGTVFCDESGNIPLPVDMKSFTASRSKSNVSVKWTTAAEWDNKGFYVQRNTRGSWENVAFVFSAAQDGNSSSDLSYSFNDLNNERGVSQYRILQVDLDGRSKASEIRSVRGEAMAAKLLVYPNPSMDGKISVVFEDGGNAARSVIVSDMSGRMIKQYRNVSTNNLSIEGLENGVYSIKVTDLSSAAVSVEKVIVKKR